MDELKKLEEYLKEKGIAFTRYDREGDWPVHQIVVYDSKGKALWDAIFQKGSYGFDRGLLEIFGKIVDYKKDKNCVVGWLTADEVIKRVEAMG